jgi:hypothetical protein
MKRTILVILAISLLSVISASAQNSAAKNDPTGKWKFEAPYAPEGFTSGTIEVGFAENKYSASILFGSEYKIQGEKVTFENDTVNFNVFLEGNDIAIKLKMDSATKMTGKASYFEGDIPLTLTKEVPNK